MYAGLTPPINATVQYVWRVSGNRYPSSDRLGYEKAMRDDRFDRRIARR